MKTEFTIGKILRPRGIKGVVKAEVYSDDVSRFSRLERVKLDDDEYVVESVSCEGGVCYFKFAGVDTPEAAEALRGKSVRADRAQLPPPPPDRYYIVDILGLDVIVDGETIGEVVDVLQYGSADVYVVRTTEGTVSFPALKSLIEIVDTENGFMKLNGCVFARTAVYN